MARMHTAAGTALGSIHNRTLARQELMDYVASLGLSQVEFHDYIDRVSGPMEKTIIEQLDDLIVRVIKRAETTVSYGDLKRRGEELHQRLHKVGAQREPVLVVIGKK